MTPQVQQINVKPDTPGEVGLPKMAVELANLTVSGIDGDYNRFRKKKKNNDLIHTITTRVYTANFW